MTHISFPSLEQYMSVFQRETYHDQRRTVTFGAKPKLHGTNSSIRVMPDSTVVAQSSKKDLDPENDNCGFALFLEPQKPLWAKAAICQPLTFFGEWAGPGINKGDAIQRTNKQRLFLFGVGVGTMPHPQNAEKMLPRWMITEPESISALLPDGLDPDLVRVMPWTGTFTFDFSASVDETLERLNDAVDAIAIKDPYIENLFGIQHPGEGLVLVEKSDGVDILSGEAYLRSSFKAKTEKHRVRKQSKPAMKKDPLPPSADAFADAYVTQARLNQAIDETCPDEITIKKTGLIMTWMLTDIEKEGQEDLTDINLTFEKVTPLLRNRIRDLWMEQL